EKSGLSKAWVAERLGISKQALNYLLKHAVKPKFVDELAGLLSLNPEWLEQGIGAPQANRKTVISSKMNKIPLMSKDSSLNQPMSMWDSPCSIEFSNDNIKNFIAYSLDDNSNFPPFIQGSILIFDISK